MSYWDDNPEFLQLSAPTVAQTNGSMAAGGFTGAGPAQAGQFANNQQGFLDYATQKWGADPSRGQGFVNAQAGGGLENMLKQYTADTGNIGKFMGGPSGDRVDFGSGVQDALTSGGQIWNPAGGGVTGHPTGGSLGGGGFTGTGMPSGPIGINSGMGNLGQPGPFSYPASTQAPFQSPSEVPGMQQLGYNPLSAPDKVNAVNYSSAPTLQYQDYNGPAGDSSYDFRFQQGQKATENALAHAGALRTGNAVKALTDYGQGMASTEYAAQDARNRANVAMNNQNALQFGNTNFQNQFGVQQAQQAANMGANAQNFTQGYQTNQANNAGSNAAIQGNNSNALAAQGQQFGQAATGYGLNQGAQNQGFNQALQGYQANANTALGFGNLGLGYQNSAQNYNLGLGNLGVSQGQLGLAQQGQNFNQGYQTNQQNYQQQVLDPWNMNYQLAQLGNPGAPNGQANANAQSDLYTGIGNAQAAGGVGSANAWSGALGNLGLSAQQLAYLQSLGGGNSGGAM